MADTDDVPFNRNFPLVPGVVEEIRPGVRRILCNNPSPFTFTGTVSYIVGHGKVAIIDPGPDDAAHAAALLDAVRGETVTHILVTHTHRDHSLNTRTDQGGQPARPSMPRGRIARRGRASKARSTILNQARTASFRPDVQVKDGDIIEGDGWRLEAVATPGHTANHLAFAWPDRKFLFVGDHVMGWSTSIVAPPDGSMVDYMASLERLAARGEDLYFSGHGPEIPDAPRYVRFLIRHRQAREASILHRLSQRRGGYPDHRARDLYRHRPAPDECGGLFRAGASGGSGRTRHRRDRWRSGDRRNVSIGCLKVIPGWCISARPRT